MQERQFRILFLNYVHVFAFLGVFHGLSCYVFSRFRQHVCLFFHYLAHVALLFVGAFSDDDALVQPNSPPVQIPANTGERTSTIKRLDQLRHAKGPIPTAVLRRELHVMMQ